MSSLVADLSPELAAMLLATVIGGYTLIGGLGATFYVSYFNTALIFVLILMLVIEVFYNPFSNPENPFGDSKSVFDFISCWKTPDEDMGNKGGSYLTFFSSGGLIFGIVNIVGNFGTVFCDQAYWQSSVAAKPLQVSRLILFREYPLMCLIVSGCLGLHQRGSGLVRYPLHPGHNHGPGLPGSLLCTRRPHAH